MRKRKLMGCVFWLSVILSGCISEPSAPPVSPKILPPAWMMQPPPDPLTPLSEIIGYLESILMSPLAYLI
ncbi:Rz1 family lipoprotein [Proteus mirabilis]|nr:Rz1 family lipoprotein [Proteus mirabilis]MBG6049408.1 Rz1 family lipoprotein [Proteus mirabilis]